MRSGNQIRYSKSCGNSFEYDVEFSLKKILDYDDIICTERRGFAEGYDLKSDKSKTLFECKRHAGFSWNELVKYFDKLASRTPDGYTPLLIFRAKRQPCLVMFKDVGYVVMEFSAYFGSPFSERPKGYKR